MKLFLTQLIWLLLAGFCVSCSNPPDYKPESYLNESEQKDILLKLIPYSAKLPLRYSFSDRFKPELDSFYREEATRYKFQHYFIATDSFHYFMINRPAPSLYEKRIAIAGRFKKDQSGNLVQYEEAFWTFKMVREDLVTKGKVLFAHYVEGKDIGNYMPGKRGEEEWIEFPDATCYYNKKEQRWVFALGE